MDIIFEQNKIISRAVNSLPANTIIKLKNNSYFYIVPVNADSFGCWIDSKGMLSGSGLSFKDMSFYNCLDYTIVGTLNIKL